MKINYKNIILVILAFAWLFMAMNILYSCSASYHFGKFIKKGGTIENKTEYVTTTDTIRINGKDSIITVRVPVQCPEIQIPPTRTEIRYKYRLDKKALQVMKSMYEDSLKQARKINASNNDRIKYVTKWKTKQLRINKKAETKQVKVNVWKWFFGGLAVGIWASLIIVSLTYKK